MERDFQSMFVGGEGSGSVFSSAVTSFGQNADDASYINAMYSGISTQSLFPSLDHYAIDTSSAIFPAFPKPDPVTFGFFSQDFPANRGEEQLTDQFSLINAGDQNLKSIDFEIEKLKVPKDEPFNVGEFINDVPTEPFDFLSKSSVPISSFCDSSFRQLPNLRSLEQVHEDFAFAESSQKRAKPSSDQYDLESIVRNYHLPSNYFAAFKTPEIQAPQTVAQSEMARQRRHKISNKTRCLQKLLPWDKKMDMATMLEETYKYIKFLQAQVSVLQSMPRDSSSFAIQNPSNVDGNVLGALGRLNRQQLLEVMLNSPVAQTVLYSRGCCVYSFEQLVLLKKIAQRKALYQEMVFNPFLLS
ncbi:uncharacterized protein LOC132310419 [Cornus florida]|uniref:uncharacterized protein LOC132310419 n=1 Tax=Cornus florida TaxID=4283 RepID=UPI00289CA9FA|nr:uncharacterized protein LOC132310419 [Cornus florida]